MNPFSQYLKDAGFASTRIESLNKSCSELHSALCALDKASLERVAYMGGVPGLLEHYALFEDLRDVGTEIIELEKSHILDNH